jgi:hypothetical protein
MHASVMAFGQRILTPELVGGRRVIEVGSLDVNGSLRAHVEALAPARYIGIDAQAGPGVDRVGDVVSATRLRAVDVVICTEVLEHAEDWRATVAAIKSLVVEGGLLLVTTRSPGFGYHPYPGDHWRFTLADFETIFADLTQLELTADPQPGHPGVLALYRKPTRFAETDTASIDVAPAPSP